MSIHLNINGAYKEMVDCKVNIGGTWRQGDSIYSNINGVWRLGWQAGPTTRPLSYEGALTNLPSTWYRMTGGTVGGYAFFGAGYYSSDPTGNTRAYSSTLVLQSAPSLGWTSGDCPAANAGNYLVYATRRAYNNNNPPAVAYSPTLTRTTHAVITGPTVRQEMSAVRAGNYALFAGGHNGENEAVSDVVDAYNSSLVQSQPTKLSGFRWNMLGGSIGNYGLFAGGSVGTRVEAYSSTLVRTTATALLSSASQGQNSAANTLNYVLFSSSNGSVSAYNSNLTRSTAGNRSHTLGRGASASLGGNAIFAGGQTTATVEYYTDTLVRSPITDLSVGRFWLGGASTNVGTGANEYAIFVGGRTGSNRREVDVYKVT